VMTNERPLPGDRLRIISDVGDQISAGVCVGQVATLILDDGSDCPFFVAVDDGPMSWAKPTAFDPQREPFNAERVRSAFRAASHCVAAESWDRLGALEEQMRFREVCDNREPQPRFAQEEPLSSQNLPLMAVQCINSGGLPGGVENVARRAADEEEAAFLSLMDRSHHRQERPPSKGTSQGLLSQELLWDNKSTEVPQKVTLKDSCNPQVPETGNKVGGIAEWMINQCEIDPENARRYAADLVDIGCDRLRDLVEMDQEDWPIHIKKIHLKKIMKALSLHLHGARPLSAFSANSSQRGFDSGPYQPSGGKSPKRCFLPFSTRSGYPEPAAGNVRDPSQDYDDVPRGVGGTLGWRPMAGTKVSPETLARGPYAIAGSDYLDNTAVPLGQSLHNHWRYQPASREHSHMSSMYARVQMPERGSFVHSGSNLDTSYSPLRRHAAMSQKEYVNKMWCGGGFGPDLQAGGHFYSATHDLQRGRRSPFVHGTSTPGHSDRELANLVYAGTQVSERSRRFTLLDWR